MRHSPKSKTEDLFTRANKEAEAGKLRVAFHLYLAAAKAGGTSSQINNKRAYRRGDSCAAYTLESRGEMTGSTAEHCIGSSERSGLAMMKLI